ncbi:Plus-3 domain [Musa troglodytarum]|uniref:Plus-3 domain n=1 Tax=Musa troglodytarum TaxID=320322 RepID=A0A9E7EAI5_9LILI|nr:Plus-3 domain [Musa troglodytarum]
MMKKNKLNKEEIAEDYCFTCKDGGHLRVCDFNEEMVGQSKTCNVATEHMNGKVDFRDTETYEFLFKDYWEIIKDQEGLTLIDLQAANALFKRGENYKDGSDSDKLVEEDVESEGDDLEINSEDGLSFLEDLNGRCGRRKKPIKRSRKRKLKFHKIESLLESHFATNDDSDEEISFSSEDGDTIGRRKKQNTGYDDMPHKVQPKEYKEDISAAPKSCYASIVRKNINSVYLKRSLIMEFLKSPDTFEEKVTGCFVRVKVDPEDFYFVPEKRYKLGQVTGVKKALQTYKVGTMSTDVVLRVSNYHADVQLFILSDDDFDEAELEKKIRSVHADIMTHLCTSEERKRLLQEIPTVVADISQTEVKNSNGPPISSDCQLPKASDVNNSSSGRVIEIEEDHGFQDSKITGNMQISNHVDDEDKTWHYVDPSGNEQGPFDMVSLRYWMREGFFDEDFKIWKTGQTREDAILLTDAFRLYQ